MNLQKLFMLLRAKPGLTRAQALKYLKEHHGPIVLASATLRMRVKKYVQHHVIDAPSIPQLSSDRDWIVESWVDPNVLLPEPPTAADAILVREDEQKFPDHASLVVLKVEPQHVFGADTTPGLQLFLFAKGMAVGDRGFSQEAQARLERHATGYERNTVVRSLSQAQPEYDSVEVLGFKDEAAVKGFFADGELQMELADLGVLSSPQHYESRLLTQAHIVFDFEH